MRLLALLLIGGSAALGLAGTQVSERAALGYVVGLCQANATVTDSPMPCLSVDRRMQRQDGYAVVREPIHKKRTVLTSLAAIPGIEDPMLLDARAPNFFADAWNERARFLGGSRSGEPAGFVLAINPQYARSQDRFHIHLACLEPRSLQRLADDLPRISSERFTAMGQTMQGRRLWAMRVDGTDLAVKNPLQLLAEHMPGARESMGRHLLMVIPEAWPDGRRGFVLLTNQPNDGSPILSVEPFLDKSCLAHAA
ncbi:CDP-diacylglycerol pyrophosphatase [Aureimonas jatrophae]|uniref:CDP-diacylglycerol pyrophosphatase n=2 Tax=Aureimonas jatrophae TaxID=1166073 RepID=A0A1H0NKQ9_9HYPH|nr:CDP-diacylglycerol pyrophosphatase [Aureimonas jatrophae]